MVNKNIIVGFFSDPFVKKPVTLPRVGYKHVFLPNYVFDNAKASSENFEVFPEILVIQLSAFSDLKAIENFIISVRTQEKERHLGLLIVWSGPEKLLLTLSRRFLGAGADDCVHSTMTAFDLDLRIRIIVNHKRKAEALRKANHQLRHLADHDYLTDLLNMRGFKDSFQKILQKKQPEQQLFLCMIDIDSFKRVNDSANHLFGSFCIKKVASIIRKEIEVSLKEDGICGRFGGDEYVVSGLIFSSKRIEEILESVRQKVCEAEYIDDGHEIRLSISLGMTYENRSRKINLEDLVKQADKALYLSKEKGRNRLTTVLLD